MNNSRQLRSQQGVALIEALIAILIFAFGVLGIVGLQVSMTRAQSSAKFRGDASFLANELIGTMWGDLKNFAQYDTASGKCDAYARCTDWKSKVSTTLPGGTIEVKPWVGDPKDGDVDIKVSWSVPGEGEHKYLTSTNIHTK
jgi:type IV pilus assembly protein PilV